MNAERHHTCSMCKASSWFSNMEPWLWRIFWGIVSLIGSAIVWLTVNLCQVCAADHQLVQRIPDMGVTIKEHSGVISAMQQSQAAILENIKDLREANGLKRERDRDGR